LFFVCTLLNGADFLWDIFEPVPLYDEIAHVITPFTLVAITAEIIYQTGGDDEFFDTPYHVLVTGSAIGLVGAIGWELVEILLDHLFPAASIDHALPRYNLRCLPRRHRWRSGRLDSRPLPGSPL
jgi:hypothetical protein